MIDNEFETVAEYISAIHGGDRKEAVGSLASRAAGGIDAAANFRAHRKALEEQRLELHAPTIERLVADIPVELAQVQTKGRTLSGYASVFNHPIPLVEQFGQKVTEFVRPGAFSKTIREDRSGVQALFNHGTDPRYGNLPIGTIKAL